MTRIRVAIIARTTLYTVPGGDTIQITQTAKELRLLGIETDIILTSQKINYHQYDLLHFFNITRPADILYHIRKSSLPFVVSPVFIDYSEYDKHHRKGWGAILFRWLQANKIEYIKTIMRWIKGRDILRSIEYVWKGQQRSILYILKKTSLILPNSASELKRIMNAFHYSGSYVIVPNGIDTKLFKVDTENKREQTMIICVARIEGIKNQFNLIKALNNSNYRLFLIGAPAPNQMQYYLKCKEIAGSNITFINQLQQVELLKYYQRASVHVLPSWFETTGLSSLEAGAMGCRIVISDRGDSKEYFGEDAFYCNPGSPSSILTAVEKALTAVNTTTLQHKILNNFTWKRAALQTSLAYAQVLKS